MPVVPVEPVYKPGLTVLGVGVEPDPHDLDAYRPSDPFAVGCLTAVILDCELRGPGRVANVNFVVDLPLSPMVHDIRPVYGAMLLWLTIMHARYGASLGCGLVVPAELNRSVVLVGIETDRLPEFWIDGEALDDSAICMTYTINVRGRWLG